MAREPVHVLELRRTLGHALSLCRQERGWSQRKLADKLHYHRSAISHLEAGRTGALPADVESWMLDTTAWPGSVDNYVDALVWLVSELLTDPKHFFRSFTVKELGRLMTARPADLDTRPRAHEMGIYKRYFDLITAGRKTTEIRVNDSSRQKIKPGSLIRFRCQGDEVLTRVTRVNRYPNFDDMFDHETIASVNPLATRDEQLANIRQIYPPEREALGVVAIGIELVDPPRTI